MKTIREFYKKDFDPADVRKSIVAAVSVRVQEPVFESQTKTKLGSQEVAPGGQTMRSLVLIGGTDGGVYVATDKTIFYRNNTMSDWEDYGDGLPVVLSACIARPF